MSPSNGPTEPCGQNLPKRVWSSLVYPEAICPVYTRAMQASPRRILTLGKWRRLRDWEREVGKAPVHADSELKKPPLPILKPIKLNHREAEYNKSTKMAGNMLSRNGDFVPTVQRALHSQNTQWTFSQSHLGPMSSLADVSPSSKRLPQRADEGRNDDSAGHQRAIVCLKVLSRAFLFSIWPAQQFNNESRVLVLLKNKNGTKA